MRNPGIAGLISLFVPGGGQIYNGEIGKGLLMMFLAGLSFFLVFIVVGLFTGPVVWIWSIFDARNSAIRLNESEAKKVVA